MMDLKTQFKILNFISKYDLYGPYLENIEQDTNYVIAKIMSNFLTKYSKEIKENYDIIVYFNNDNFSFMSYRIIVNALDSFNLKNNIYLLGKINFKNKKFLKGINTISQKELKNDNYILITGFNPICNVFSLKDLFNFSDIIFNPLEKMTPLQIKQTQDFYLNKNNNLYDKNILNKISKKIIDFYSYPFNKEELLEDDDFVFVPSKYYIADLSNDETDFPIYDRIIKNDKDNKIILYRFSNDNINFAKNNLMPYISFKNIPNIYNTISFTDSLDSEYIYLQLEV